MLDTISFKLNSPQGIPDTNPPLNSFGISLVLNNETFNYLLNLSEVVAMHSFKFAEFNLFTCSCGVPECAGYQDYVEHTREDSFVFWKFPAIDAYSEFKAQYQFDSKSFDNAIETLLSNVILLEEDNIFHETRLDSDFIDTGEDSYIETTCATPIMSSVEYLIPVFKAEQEFNNLVTDTCPSLAPSLFNWEYKGELIDSHPIPLKHLIGNVLNQFPDAGNPSSSRFLSKVRIAIRAIETAVYSGDHSRLHRLVSRCYRKNGLSPADLIFWRNNIPEKELFDLSKVKLVKIVINPENHT